MKFEFIDQPAIVQEKKKYANFTVREIGGPEEIVKWREQQAAKEWAYRMRLSDKDSRISEFEAKLGEKLASPTVHTTSWQEKLAFVDMERQRLKEAQSKVEEFPPWAARKEEKPSLFKMIKSFFKGLWKDTVRNA